MKTVNIKGKEYVPVNERLKEFRRLHPGYSLRTELVSVNENTALVKAVIRDDKDRILAEGTAHERADQKGSMVNSTSHVENAETSAWGRALGNLGIGIDASVATADEVANAVANQGKTRRVVKTEDPSELSRLRNEIWEQAGKDLTKVRAATQKAGIVGEITTVADANKVLATLAFS